MPFPKVRELICLMISWQDAPCTDESKYISKPSLHAYSEGNYAGCSLAGLAAQSLKSLGELLKYTSPELGKGVSY